MLVATLKRSLDGEMAVLRPNRDGPSLVTDRRYCFGMCSFAWCKIPFPSQNRDGGFRFSLPSAAIRNQARRHLNRTSNLKWKLRGAYLAV